MMARLRDQKDAILAKPEDDLLPQPASGPSTLTIGTSRRWSGFKNPRIVRVSRSFGGKDRHSKVCTIRGLRDRRIRLSVPTAIQLYHLQERLGLNQPSKVIDWLIHATKLHIDELPPLNFPQFHDQHSLFDQLSNDRAPPLHRFDSYLDANLTLVNREPAQFGSSRTNENDQDSLQAKPRWSYNNNRNNNNENNQYPSFFSGSLVAPYGGLSQWDPSNWALSAPFEGQGSLGPASQESNVELGSGHGGESSSNATQQLFTMPTSTASVFPQDDTSAAMPAGFAQRWSVCHVSNTNQQINEGT